MIQIKYYYIDDEEVARNSGFRRSAKISFHCLGGARNVTIRYDVSLCVECTCSVPRTRGVNYVAVVGAVVLLSMSQYTAR